MGSGILVLNQPGVYLVDADGNVVTLADGATIGSAEAFLIAGKDGTLARFAKVTAAGRVVTDGSEVTQPISAAALPLPSGAATEATLAAIRDTAGVKKITDALPAGTNAIGKIGDLQAWLGSSAPTVGQKAMAASVPVVIASDQAPITVASSGVLDYVNQGLMFSAAVQVNTASAAADNPLLYLKNPSANTKSFWVSLIQAGTSIANVGMIYKVFANPTITANGTTVTPTPRKVGGAASSIEAYSLSTASAFGSLLSALTQGQNGNALIFLDDFSLRVDPSNSLLITGRPSSNNRESLVTAIWMEDVP